MHVVVVHDPATLVAPMDDSQVLGPCPHGGRTHQVAGMGLALAVLPDTLPLALVVTHHCTGSLEGPTALQTQRQNTGIVQLLLLLLKAFFFMCRRLCWIVPSLGRIDRSGIISCDGESIFGQHHYIVISKLLSRKL